RVGWPLLGAVGYRDEGALQRHPDSGLGGQAALHTARRRLAGRGDLARDSRRGRRGCFLLRAPRQRRSPPPQRNRPAPAAPLRGVRRSTRKKSQSGEGLALGRHLNGRLRRGRGSATLCALEGWSVMRFFRPEVERALKLLGGLQLLAPDPVAGGL